MKYWFLYNTLDGSMYGTPYLGDAEEWTNIPNGCNVIGPIEQPNTTAADAFQNPDCYTIQNGVLTPVVNIDQIKSDRATKTARQASIPSLDDRIKELEDLRLADMGL